MGGRAGDLGDNSAGGSPGMGDRDWGRGSWGAGDGVDRRFSRNANVDIRGAQHLTNQFPPVR